MVTAIIQARMTSSRLPGKVMMDLCGKPVIAHIIERLQRCEKVEQLVLATSIDSSDDVLAHHVQDMKVACYRGDLHNVLKRFYYAACETKATHIVRICADSPLLDWEIIDRTIRAYLQKSVDIVKTINMPLGLGTEVFSFSSLEKAYHQADREYQREHVTPYIYEHGSTYNYVFSKTPSPFRLTLDTLEDLEVIRSIYGELYHGRHDFHYKDIAAFLKREPAIAQINEMIEQVSVPLQFEPQWN